MLAFKASYDELTTVFDIWRLLKDFNNALVLLKQFGRVCADVNREDQLSSVHDVRWRRKNAQIGGCVQN